MDQSMKNNAGYHDALFAKTLIADKFTNKSMKNNTGHHDILFTKHKQL